MRRLIGMAVALLWCTPALAAESVWRIDPAHSSVQFAVRHLMVSTVRGHFGKVSGLVRLDDADVTRSTVEAVIEAGSIDTRDARRDAHLKDTDFLDVSAYPTIEFRSKSLTRVDEGRYRLVGDLTLHGVTRPVALDVEGSPTPIVDPAGNIRLGGVARAKVDRREFGITFSKAMDSGGLVVGNEVEIVIDVELLKAGPGP